MNSIFITNLSIGVIDWGLERAFKSSLKGTEFGGKATDLKETEVYSPAFLYVLLLDGLEIHSSSYSAC